MSFLVCTPMFGAFCTAQYCASVLKLKEELVKAGIDHDFLISWNESLITRGRDKMARTFLNDTAFDRLLFIDADIQFEPEDVAKLWNLDADIGVGAYRNKKLEAPWGAWVGGKLVSLETINGPAEVDYAGTGFMMIKRHVFEKLKSLHPEWKHQENEGETWGFFQDPITDIHLSEDYFFCKESREAGFKVVLDPTIRLKHWGQMAF